MSTSTPVPADRPPVVPPEEQFWQRYSAHHEAPLSGVSSTVLHVLILLLILGIGWVQSFIKADEELRPLPIITVRMGDNLGQPGPGPADAIGPVVPGNGQEAGPPPQGNVEKPPTDVPTLTPSKPAPLTPDSGKDRAVQRPQGPDTDVAGVLDGISKSARTKLSKMVKPGPGGGGGGGNGPGGGTLNPTMRRLLRWVLLFNTRDERDYLNQLVDLGAMLAVPIDEEKGRFLLVRDLRNPKTAREEDISELNRIFWIDEKPHSLRSLFATLDVRRPAYFVALFPRELELKMRRLEQDYTEREFRTRDEDGIVETTFEVIKERDRYDVRVKSAYMKRKR